MGDGRSPPCQAEDRGLPCLGPAVTQDVGAPAGQGGHSGPLPHHLSGRLCGAGLGFAWRPQSQALAGAPGTIVTTTDSLLLPALTGPFHLQVDPMTCGWPTGPVHATGWCWSGMKGPGDTCATGSGR